MSRGWMVDSGRWMARTVLPSPPWGEGLGMRGARSGYASLIRLQRRLDHPSPLTPLPKAERRTAIVGWRSIGMVVAALITAFGSLVQSGRADDTPPRRVFVPLEQLDVVLDRNQRGVIMPRKEFDLLWAAAKKAEAESARPAAAAVVSAASYGAKVDGDQLVIAVELKFRQFVAGWQSISLPFRGVGVEAATVDGKPARIGRSGDDARALVLFSREVGEHTLALELSANLALVGSDRVAAFGIAPVPSATLEVDLPAGKQLELNGLLLDRPAALDRPAKYSVAVGGKRDVALRITDRQEAKHTESLVFAATAIGLHVAPEELTWRAVTTLNVFGRPIDQVQLVVPRSLDIVSVTSSGLEGWGFAPGNDDTTILTLSYRQAFQESRTITLQGVASNPGGTPWSVPPLRVTKATSHVVRVLVQHPPSLRLQATTTDGVRRVTADEAPPSDMPTMPDMPTTVDPTLTQYFAAWREDFSLVFVTQPRARELQATIATRLDVDSRELNLRSSIAVQTHFAPLFDLDLTLPAAWNIVDVKVGDQPATWRTVPLQAGLHQVRVSFSPPVPIDGSKSITLVAQQVPTENWPLEESPFVMPVPEIHLPQVGVTEGTYMIAADDDLDLIPEELSGLDPARLPTDQVQLTRPPRLVYSYQDTRFTGRLKIVRKPARVAATTVAFHRLDPETLASHLEARLAIEGGGVRKVQLALPEAAGTELRFRLVGGINRITEQTAADPADGVRVWTLQLDQRAYGNLWLVVDMVASRGKQTEDGGSKIEDGGKDSAPDRNPPSSILHPQMPLPSLRVVGADRQEGYIGLEAGPEQQLAITATDAADLALSEIAPADLPVPVEYLPKERIVAGYRSVAAGERVTVAETRFDRVAVPTAICDANSLTSVLGETGEMQHRAEFRFRAVGVQSLRVELPADAILWATLLDGQPVEVRRLGRGSKMEDRGSTKTAIATDSPSSIINPPASYLIPLSLTDDAAESRRLELFYRTKVDPLGASGMLRQALPKLTAIDGSGESQPLTVLQRDWTLHHPAHTNITDSDGTLTPERPPVRDSLLGHLQQGIHVGSGDELLRKGAWLAGVIAFVGFFTYVARRRGNKGVIEALLVLVVLGIVWALLLPATQQARVAAHRAKQRYDTTLGDYALPTAQEGAPMDPRSVIPHPTAAPTAPARVPGDKSAMFDDVAQSVAPKSAEPESETRGRPMDAKAADRPTSGEDLIGQVKEARKSRGEKVPAESEEAAPLAGRKKALKKSEGRKSGGGVQADFQPLIDALNKERWSEVAGEGNVTQFDQKLSLVIRQTATFHQPEGGQTSRGLLSLALQLDVPTGSRATKFVQAGDAADDVKQPALEVRYQNHEALSFVGLMLIAGSVTLFWFLRNSSAAVRTVVGVLGLTLPLALVSLVPVSLLPYLDGLFLGAAAGLALWLILAVARYSGRIWSAMNRNLTAKPTAALWLIAAGVVAFSATGYAQESKAVAKPPTALPFVPRDAILVPFDDGTDPLKSERVFLPYDKFIELWNLAHPNERVEAPASADGVVAEALLAAKLIPGVEATKTPARIAVAARFVLHSFREHQITLPLPLGNVALMKAEFDGRPALLTTVGVPPAGGAAAKKSAPAAANAPAKAGTPAAGLAIVVEKSGVHVLDLTFTIPAEQSGPAGKFTLPVGRAPTAGAPALAGGVLRFALPGKDLALKVNGASGVFRVNPKAEEFGTALVPLDATGDITVSWAPARTQDAVDAIVHVDAATAVVVDDSGMRISSGFQFAVRQGTLTEAAFTLPAGVLVRQIAGPDVGGWQIGDAAADQPRELKVFLRREVRDTTTLVFDLFVPLSLTETSQSVAVPAFGPIGVTRETGTVAVFAERQFVVSSGTVSGLTQIDAGKFQPAVTIQRPQTPPLLAYRYVQRPFEWTLLAARQKPQSKVAAEHALHVGLRKMRVSSRFELTLAGAPRSDVVVSLPPRYLLYDLEGPDVADYSVAKANGDAEAASNVLRIELAAPKTGAVDLVLNGIVLREPSDAAQLLAVPVLLGVNEQRSSVGVWLDPVFSGTIGDLGSWKSVDPNLLTARLRGLRPTAVQFAFTSNASQPAAAQLALRRATPRLTADSLTTVIVQETSIQYVLSLQWQIAQAAESRFVFETPDWLAGGLDFSGNAGGPRIRQVLSEKMDGQRVRWIVELEEPQRERYFLTAKAVLPPVSGDAVVSALRISVSQATTDGPAGEFQRLPVREFLVLVNQSGSQLTATAATAVESVPAVDLPIKIQQSLVDQAAEISQVKTGQAAVGWQMRKRQQVKSLAASVNLAELTLVVAKDGSWRGQADYRIQNRARQFLAVRLPERSQVLSLFVAGQPSRPVRTKKGTDDVLLIPLPKQAAGDLSVEVKLVTSGRLDSALPHGLKPMRDERSLPAPHVYSQTEDPEHGMPVARTEWTVYLPDDIDARPVDDRDRMNMTPSESGFDRLTALVNEGMQLQQEWAFNAALNYNPDNYRVQVRSGNNLKQLAVAIHDNQSVVANPNLDAGKRQELNELIGRFQQTQRQQQEAEFKEERNGKVPVVDGKQSGAAQPQVDFGLVEQQLQLGNSIAPSKGESVGGDFDGEGGSDRRFRFAAPEKPAVTEGKPEEKTAGKSVSSKGAQVGQRRSQLRELNESQTLQLNRDQSAELAKQVQSQAGVSLNAPAQQPVGGPGAGSGAQPAMGGMGEGFGGRGGVAAGGAQPQRPTVGLGFQSLQDLRADSGRAIIAVQPQNVTLGEVAANADVSGLVASAGEQAGLAGWARAGGLSLEIDLPESGQKLTFSKVGGDPLLTLGLRPKASLKAGFGLAWFVIWLALGLGLVSVLNRGGNFTRLASHAPILLIAVGLVWYVLLPAAVIGLVLFTLGAIAFGWQHRRAAA